MIQRAGRAGRPGWLRLVPLLAVIGWSVPIAFADLTPLGFLAWDVTSPGNGQFDIVNQTGPNSSLDSTWPVTTELLFSSLDLNVLFNNGDSVDPGPSYFSPNPDGESWDGSQIPIGGTNPLPVMATLTGDVAPASIVLFDGSTAAIVEPAFTTILSDSPNLQDGDFAIITVQTVATPEPATCLLLGTISIFLLFARSRRGWPRAALVLTLGATGVVSSQRAFAAAWANPGDSCASMNPSMATPWDAWMQAKAPDPRAKAEKSNATDWIFLATDKTARVTPSLPTMDGEPFDSEGPYCRTIQGNFGNFYLNIQYQAVKSGVIPKGIKAKGLETDSAFGNSGVYIYDRWEVQIIDPSQFDDPANKKAYGGGVPNGKTIMSDTGEGRKTFDRNTLVPGSLYGVNPVRDDDANITGDALYLNQANPFGNWNTLEITFCVTQADGTPIRPPQLKSVLNGNTVYYGKKTGVPGNGTGQRAKEPKPVYQGPIYLQSHWGSQVQFRNPTFDSTKATCPLP